MLQHVSKQKSCEIVGYLNMNLNKPEKLEVNCTNEQKDRKTRKGSERLEEYARANIEVHKKIELRKLTDRFECGTKMLDFLHLSNF